MTKTKRLQNFLGILLMSDVCGFARVIIGFLLDILIHFSSKIKFFWKLILSFLKQLQIGIITIFTLRVGLLSLFHLSLLKNIFLFKNKLLRRLLWSYTQNVYKNFQLNQWKICFKIYYFLFLFQNLLICTLTYIET